MSTLQADIFLILLILIEIGISIYVCHCERDIAARTDSIDPYTRTVANVVMTVRWPDQYGNHWHTTIHLHEIADLIDEQPLLALAIQAGTARISIHPTTEGTLQ